MAITKITLEDETTAEALCDLLKNQQFDPNSTSNISQAEIWVRDSPVYLFDNVHDPRPDAIVRSLKDTNRRRSTAIAWARASLPREVFYALGLLTD